MKLESGKDYLISFGGLNIPDSQQTEFQSVYCYKSTDISTCLNMAIPDSYIIDPTNKSAYFLKPATSVNPPAIFGHDGAIVELTSGNMTRKYLYFYGGASSSCTGNVCSQMWRFEIPWAPIQYFENNGTTFGNNWEAITNAGGTSPGQLYAFSITKIDNYIYLYGGLDQTFT